MVCPEGTRTKDGKLQPFKKGAMILAIETGLPIVPVAVCGAFHGMPF
jgi:1-acyl-sn-glycerol-3-phosphate acyltransferase